MSLPIPSDDCGPDAYARKVPTPSRGPRIFAGSGPLGMIVTAADLCVNALGKVSRPCRPALVRVEQAAPDVVAVELARPVDLPHGSVGPFERCAEIGSQSADGEHPPPRAHQLRSFNGGTGVKDFDPLDGPGPFDLTDRPPRPPPAGLPGG